MTRHSRFVFVTFVLIGAMAVLGGCSNPEGYSETAPPTGGPQQNSHVPPGEKPASPATSSSSAH